MRPLFRLVPAGLLLALGALVLAADPPPQLVKPVVPAANAARIRLLADGKRSISPFKAQIPNPKGKKGETTEIKLHVYPHGGSSTTASIQQWKAWGFEVPANREAVLSELIIPAVQVAPKLTKGRDVEVRVTNIKVFLYEAPGGDAGGKHNSLSLSLEQVAGAPERAAEPRVFYADRFIELTVPSTAIKKLNTGDTTSPDPQATAGDKLVPAVAPSTAAGNPQLAFVSVNGQTQYFRATGKMEAVTAGVGIGAGTPPGITMTVNMARGCGVELDKEMMPRTGKVRELRFGLLTGSGFKFQKDLVLKEVTVRISNNEDASFISLDAGFVEAYFTDGVYGCASDGLWRLHGRVKPDLLEDIKTRKPVVPKKP